ncbi:hypothetical protein G6F70_000221 [Rhizopus microsporus]|nr:hypothetical protein G6F71_001655 [Rhizopus microsporus]KAG1204769.1 hypothetical protein G6F70_000221 [Rhizopus microsporus]KAG1216061.1 hypothetical protein G6F69_000381 [Rhizopus microsporus]KAG1238179.1 hypothetical protein G6F67_000642 [Rhizopus microsporus]KAG1260945.1 hypothetical protein G6F68_007053 [Rhizopus microsporus]
MDLTNKELLMKRLADASQIKIYPPMPSRYEVPLRKILLTTRLWNNVRRQQQILLELPPDAWLAEGLDDFISHQGSLNHTEDATEIKCTHTTIDATETAEDKSLDNHVMTTTTTTTTTTTVDSTSDNNSSLDSNILSSCDWSWFNQVDKDTLSTTSETLLLDTISASSNSSNTSNTLQQEQDDTQLLLNCIKSNNLLSHEPEVKRSRDGEDMEENQVKKLKKMDQDQFLLHFTLPDAPGSPAGPAPTSSASSTAVLLSA